MKGLPFGLHLEQQLSFGFQHAGHSVELLVMLYESISDRIVFGSSLLMDSLDLFFEHVCGNHHVEGVVNPPLDVLLLSMQHFLSSDSNTRPC